MPSARLAGSLTDSEYRVVRRAFTRAERLVTSLIARPDLDLRSVSVTRALAVRLVAFVSRPETFSRAPGAIAAFGGALIDRSLVDGAAACDVPAPSATTAPDVNRHASGLASRNDNWTSPLLRPAAPHHLRLAAAAY